MVPDIAPHTDAAVIPVVDVKTVPSLNVKLDPLTPFDAVRTWVVVSISTSALAVMVFVLDP